MVLARAPTDKRWASTRERDGVLPLRFVSVHHLAKPFELR